MPDKNKDLIDQKLQDLNHDGVDHRGFLKCMAWAGTGLVWTMSAGIPSSRAFAKTAHRSGGDGGDFTFVQISDGHICFNKPANPDVTATLQTAINKINAMPNKPDFNSHPRPESALEAGRVRYAGPGIERSVCQADLLCAR
jgi:Icc protein